MTMVVDIVLPIVIKIGKYLVAPVGRQFGYLIFYDRNIKNLEKQVQKLEDKRFGVQKSVEEAEAKREIIAPDVERWLTTVNKLNEEAKKFLEDEVKANKGCLNRWCPNSKSRYSLSRKATKKTQSVEELLREGGDFSRVAYPAPREGISFTSIGGYKAFESRSSIMNNVMEALADDGIYMIGICGMGGVGKTTLVKEVAKKAKEKKMFDKIVMVLVSQNPDLISIQGQIAKLLDFELFGENNLLARAEDLRTGIQSKGKVLTILDDVWKRLDLNEMGIPCGDNHEGCKIVMTSRSEDVCNGMDTQKNFMVSVLHEEEGWNLFKEMAEISDEDTSHPTGLQLTQMAVAKECGGLPIAIATVGRALKCKNKYSWDSALEQLQKSIVKNISGVDEKVFKSLQLSYDFLESDEAKKCFLLCSLYSEDFDIPIEDLVRYAIGIELFERIDSVHQARNRVYSLVDNLKKCYLLMESEEEKCIKMHDVVRDVAISIASRKKHSFLVRCDEALKEWPKKNRPQKYTIISLKVNGVHCLPGNLKFPKLQLLQLDCNAGLPPISSYNFSHRRILNAEVQETPDSFYQEMKKLKVLALSDMYSSLPTSLQCLTNLRTLSLFRCRLIDDGISVIGALENLEILRFGDSYIKELPKEIIGHLAHLKVLDLLGCLVEKIYPGVLSSLSKLEELYVGSIFQSWCVDEESEEGAQAIIDELPSLSNLVALDIDLIDISFWPRGLVIEKLKKFNICVGNHNYTSFCDPSLSNQLKLDVEYISDIIETRPNFLLKSTEILCLKCVKGLKILCDLVGEDGFECLKKLSLRYLSDLEYLINTADGVPQRAFPVLEFLELEYLPTFKGITSPTQLVWLGNLTSVEVRYCRKLKSMFSLSIARDLVQLQHLTIVYCPMMEEIVSSEGGEHEIAATATDEIEFPKLEELLLEDLPSLTAICKAMNAIQLPRLSSLSLEDMPKLKRLWPASDSESNCDPIIQPLFNDKDKLATIEELTICRMENLMEIWPGELEAKLREMTVKLCHGLSNILFPSNSIKGMQNLEVLRVEDCRSIGVAFDLEGLVWEGTLDMALPSLENVELSHLPKLTHVWKDNSPRIQGFQNLRSLVVNECNSLKNLFSYSVVKLLVNLQEIKVTECDMMESIIGNEPNADDAVITNMIMFPQLSSLILSDLPSLSSFCFEACTFEGSLLETIEVINCPKMKILPSAFQCKLEQQKADFSTSSQLHLLDGKFIFSDWFHYHFGKLTITDINGSREMWHNQLEVDRLNEVRFMLVQCCGKLSYLISLNLIQRLPHLVPHLERLKVLWCDSLETIFDLQGSVHAGTTSAEGTSIIRLGDLKLMYLPKLMHIWKNVSQQTHWFANIKSLEVERCDSLRYIFTISMVKVLRRLNYLRIGNCEKVEKIVTREAEKEEVWSIINILNVELENLPSLVCIGIPESQIHISELRVNFCPKYRGNPDSVPKATCPSSPKLPPRVRPFIPERYAPPAHVLPQAVFRHFTDFNERAPGDLLLREPEYHLSHEAREVGSRTVWGYGSPAARDWYAELPKAVRDLVDLAGFGSFCVGLSRCPVRRTLLAALVERWWDTTNSFHFSATGDLTMTPLDFAVLTGLDIGGWPIPYDEDMGEWEAAWIHLLGTRPPVDRASGRVRYTWFSSHFRREEMEPETPKEAEQYARGFLMFLFGTTLFADRGNTVGLYLLSALVDLSQVRRYDWGGAGLATLYCYMSATSRRQGDLLGGYWRAWELWVYVYFPTLAPELVVAGPLMTPYSLVFEGQHRPRPQETLFYLRQYFDTVRTTEITWQPWAPMGDGLRFQYAGGSGTSQYRILFEGPVGRAWFLGERFLRQVWGYTSQDPPAAPPVSMRTADRLSSQDVVSAILGTDALLHLEEGDYATYRHVYLMPPLTGVRTPSMRPIGVPSSSQARATDIPSSSRAGTSRGEGGSVPPIPPTLHYPGWPDMPTKLTSWRFGAPYQVLLEPPLPNHRYVRDPDSPPPPVEYVDEMLGVMAAFEGMILRREAQLAIMGVQMPPVYAPLWAGPPRPSQGGRSCRPFRGAGPAGPFRGAGPSRPFWGAGPSRPFRGARGGSSHRRRAHIIEAEPDENEEEEVAGRQSETSAEKGDSGLGFGSGGEAEGGPEDECSDPDGDGGAEVVSQKRMRRASHSRSREY